MKKFYAVRSGRHVGIFDTWEACEREVKGYSGAEYKSFSSREAALEYLGVTNQISLFDEKSASAYVDGSYNAVTGEYGCGVVIFFDGEETTFSKKFSDPEAAKMRNVAGEIEGARLAMRWCADNNVAMLDLCYDYEGIEKWCTGEWKTNKTGTIEYKRFYDEISAAVTVRFHKIKGHSGDKYNDMADALAKKAVGIG